MTIKAHFDGKAFVPDEPVDVPINQAATVLVRPAATRPPLNEEEFERLMAEMDRAAISTDHPVDWSRDNIYSGTLDDTR